MGVYYVNEAAFEIDDAAFEDRTVHVLASRDDLATDVSLLVSRSPYRAGETLAENVTRHVDRERRALTGWRQLFQREAQIEDAPMIELATRWKGAAGLVYQRQAHIGLARVVLLVVANGRIEDQELCDAHVARALETFRTRRE